MLGVSTAPFPAPLARVFARTITRLGGGGGDTPAPSVSPDALPFERNILTHDRRRYERERAQLRACPDLALGAPTWGWLDFAFTAMDELGGGAGVSGIDIPVVMVAAGDDRLVDNAAAERIAGRLAKGRFVEVPGAFHELLQETDEVRAVFWREFDALAGQVAPI
jgi:lysophospholipase